jgi:tripartite-type tricarboxylate transporter receptor subunit TctC
MKTLRFQQHLATSVLLILATTSAWAQTTSWPTQSVRIVVGFSAGGPTTVAKLQGLGMEPQHNCRDAFGADMDRDAKAYIKLARELDLKAE